ncbi:four-carbon acid sugar kinase family protein [Cryobacterium sp. Y62]|uniref:four-carbon acid sugar kinase family protein n=1 Tax=Cryobacterium sp. Y62 TaxID=2048284 RepID=UPI000CE560F6|nr:four-carbon acid sugar kinase family protein [Cryobacterium sp. Y62]
MTTGRLLTFYGDDFTGSVDVLLQYQWFGLTGVIFLGLPSQPELEEAARKFDVVGIAGTTRSMLPDRIRATLRPAFERLALLKPALVQYKVCSTADSSPTIGSFAPAFELGRELFGLHPVPFLVAQPDLKRYTVYSNHFAGDRGTIYRLDRQPVMANHPITPMRESDLTSHLEAQLEERIGAVTLQDLHADGGRAAYAFADINENPAVVIDALTEPDLREAGTLIMRTALETGTAFAVGSGGLSVAVASGLVDVRPHVEPSLLPADGPCLAVSGSCSALTDDQIAAALSAGWEGILLDPQLVASDPDSAVSASASVAAAAIAAGRSAVVYTCGPNQLSVAHAPSVEVVSRALAQIILEVRSSAHVTRVIICGGDTSGHVVTALEASSLSSTARVGTYTLLLELHSEDPRVDGLEVVLKGGQIGERNFFELVRVGNIAGILRS